MYLDCKGNNNIGTITSCPYFLRRMVKWPGQTVLCVCVSLTLPYGQTDNGEATPVCMPAYAGNTENDINWARSFRSD